LPDHQITQAASNRRTASNELRAISRDQNVISAGCKASCARRSLAFEFGPGTGERERRAIIIECEPDDILLSLLPLATTLHVLPAMKSISADCGSKSLMGMDSRAKHKS
jgi:hypothetical protein